MEAWTSRLTSRAAFEINCARFFFSVLPLWTGWSNDGDGESHEGARLIIVIKALGHCNSIAVLPSSLRG